jgi:hypothetical protein
MSQNICLSIVTTCGQDSQGPSPDSARDSSVGHMQTMYEAYLSSYLMGEGTVK